MYLRESEHGNALGGEVDTPENTMGHFKDETIIVKLYDDADLARVREFVATLPNKWADLFAFCPTVVNKDWVVIMAPDGSKEGWRDSEQGDKYRKQFIEVLRKCGGRPVHVICEDGESPVVYRLPNAYSDSDL